MSDVYIAFGTLLSLGIVFPGLLMACWLLFPGRVGRAQTHLASRPLRSFVVGVVMLGIIGLPTLLLFAISLPFTTFLGAGLIVVALAFSSIGAAGLTGWMAERLAQKSGSGLSDAAAFVRAAIVLELGAAFPIVGWFLFIPFCIIISLGAATQAFIGRRVQHRKPEPQPADSAPTIHIHTAGAADVS